MNRFGRTALCAAALSCAACDPVISDQVDALGGESNGVRPGPQHRPGQPCLLCHDGELGDPPQFSIAGTVFMTPSAEKGTNGATVVLHNADGSMRRVTSNSAGNFYLSPSEFTPAFPLQVEVVYHGVTVTMHSTIGRDGACGSCHRDPPGPDSPGHVYVMFDDGGVPP